MWAGRPEKILITQESYQGLVFSTKYTPMDRLAAGPEAVRNNPAETFKYALDIPKGQKWILSWAFKSTADAMQVQPRIYYADGNHDWANWDILKGANRNDNEAGDWIVYSETFDLSTNQLGLRSSPESFLGEGYDYRYGNCIRNTATKLLIGFAADIPGTTQPTTDAWAANWLDSIELKVVPQEHPYKYRKPYAISANNVWST
tara:strand:- start:18 stop:626 length:609 start_codon:yes stop_codon:yes gene_type:complete